MLLDFGQQIKSLSTYLTFETNCSQKLHFYVFVDTNSHLMTKPYNFYIKSQSPSSSYDRNGFFGNKFKKEFNNRLTNSVTPVF